MKAPCKDCRDRVLKCHDSCEKYKAFKAERQDILDKKQKYNASWPLGHQHIIADRYRY